MPRQSRSSRPAARPAAAPPAQSRGAATMAAPPAAAHHQPMAPAPAATHAPAAASQGPGMIAQMAATAGSVAIGSTIGHGLSNMLFGSSSSAPAAAEPAAAAPVQQQSYSASCDFQAKEFTKCLEHSDVNGCNWFLEQLKACQSANSPRPFN